MQYPTEPPVPVLVLLVMVLVLVRELVLAPGLSAH